jgi:hypothetical protein
VNLSSSRVCATNDIHSCVKMWVWCSESEGERGVNLHGTKKRVDQKGFLAANTWIDAKKMYAVGSYDGGDGRVRAS